MDEVEGKGIWWILFACIGTPMGYTLEKGEPESDKHSQPVMASRLH